MQKAVELPKFMFEIKKCPDGERAHAVVKVQGYGWCGKCGFMAEERYVPIKFPKVKLLPLPKFPLKDLRERFKIAEFERKPDNHHINKIVKSILTNQFYDNIMRVVEKDGIWVVIDAQHRTEALIRCHEKYGLEYYDLVLEIYPAEYARIIYRALNVGKPLRAYDHTYAMDNGKVPFFTELKPWLSHYRQTNKLSFVDMIYSLRSARYLGKDMAGSISMIDDYLPKITPEDIAYCKIFLENTKTKLLAHSIIHKYAIYRNFFKVAFLNQMTAKQVTDLRKMIEESDKIQKAYLMRGKQSVAQIQGLIHDMARQVMGL